MNPQERAILKEAVKLLTDVKRVTSQNGYELYQLCTIVGYERLHKDVAAMLNGLLHPCECKCKCE